MPLYHTKSQPAHSPTHTNILVQCRFGLGVNTYRASLVLEELRVSLLTKKEEEEVEPSLGSLGHGATEIWIRLNLGWVKPRGR